jgi:hypothetical protein
VTASSPSEPRHGWGWGAVGYLVLLGALALPWLRTAADSVPAGDPLSFPDDARLLVWILGWVAHALAVDPRHLLDANIYWPLRGELATVEHLASTQIVSAPIIWLTGNAILAMNLVIFASYPLGALAMERLLTAYGCAAPVAWTGGLLFVLGPFRVPANVQLIQYLNVHLALPLWALHCLRERQGGARTLVLAVVVAAGLLASYYTAVMVAMVATVGTIAEAARRAPGRAAFVSRALAAGTGASALLLVVSIPYLSRAAAGGATEVGRLETMPLAALPGVLVLLAERFFGVVPAALALGGLGVLAARGRPRFAAGLGALLFVAGLVVVTAPPFVVTVVQATPLRFLRAQLRFAVVCGVGVTLLAAAALDVAWRRLGSRRGCALVAVVVAAALATRGWALAGRRDRIAAAAGDAPAYATVAATTRELGRGPLLELPLVDARFATRESWLPTGNLEPEGMIGSMVHWLPLLTGHSAYPPAHRAYFEELVGMLPAGGALDELVDATELRWLLLRPPDYWATPAVRDALLALPDVHAAATWHGWTVARVERTSRHPEWVAALAEGPQPGRSLLGTPLAPLADARGAIAVPAPPPRVLASVAHPLRVTVTNAGTASWPALLAPGSPDAFAVRLAVTWRRGSQTDTTTLPLRRDVLPGETVQQVARIVAPRDPGSYTLELRLVQAGGPPIAHEPATLGVAVVPPGG